MKNLAVAKVIPLSKSKRIKTVDRKTGVNKNKLGSVNNRSGKVWLDFRYFGERIRESCHVVWNKDNVKEARGLLDKIDISIRNGEFRYAEVFPSSSKKEYFTDLETKAFKLKPTPEKIKISNYCDNWYDILRETGRVTERTLIGYKSILDIYIKMFFVDSTFDDLNATILDKFVAWARKRKYKGKVIQNKTINKSFTVLKMVCRAVAIEYDWKTYNPFFGHKKLKEKQPREYVAPFSIDEQNKIIENLPDFWKPYFGFAFFSGLRQGEQLGIKYEDIDFKNKVLHIRRAITLDKNHNSIEGKTKNEYSRRDIHLTEPMYNALKEQETIYNRFKEDYFFCSPTGKLIHRSNLRLRIWLPTLKKAGIKYRGMINTRHSFASVALSSGEDPSWIAKIMGHCNTEMIFATYASYIKKSDGYKEGDRMTAKLNGSKSNNR